MNVGDLLGVLTGMFFADDGSRHAIFTKYSEGRIRDTRNAIDLYVCWTLGVHPNGYSTHSIVNGRRLWRTAWELT